MLRRFRLILVALATFALALFIASRVTAATLTGAPPIIIGHRGTAGYMPEETIASYELAIKLGADFIEPDLVPTKDGVLIARHENNIAETTNVADHPEFANRKATKVVDGSSITGWFTEDFTLAEIKTLRAKERLPFRNHSLDGQFEVLTFQEVLDLAKRKSAETGRTIGVYPETKHPTYFKSVGLPLEDRLINILVANGYTRKTDPIFIQSFEVGNLQYLHTQTDLRLILLYDESSVKPYDFVVSGDPRTFGDLATPAELAKVAKFASGIGPYKRLIVPAATVDQNGDGQPDDLNGDGLISDADSPLQAPTSLVDDAHVAGLLVHPYTFRSEGYYLAPDYKGNPALEYEQFFKLGVDGLFSDFSDAAVAVRNRVAGNPNK